MATEAGIARRKSDPDGLDFDGLRKTGIELVQALCGEVWTDYNLHDPGVTLLEMLCYGLTDLLYRADLPVADLLTREQGSIDYRQQALFLPQDILPAAPCTLADYRKLLYDQLPDIDDVWLRMVRDAACPQGLLTVHLKPHADASSAQLKQQVRSLMAAWRNCGEDLHKVDVVNTQHYWLAGEIEIDDSRSSSAIQADILFECAKHLSSAPRMIRFEDAIASGMAREQLLTGPLTEHGYLDEFARDQYRVDVVNLIGLIRKLPGVVAVRRLHLLDEQQAEVGFLECDPDQNRFPVLSFPETVAQMQLLQLVYRRAPDSGDHDGYQATRRVALPQDQARLEQLQLALKKRDFEHQAYRRNQGRLDRLLELPTGRYYPLHDYFSISGHAPPVYGINRFGIPATEPPEVHARARQLKAYLYPFEQLLANYLQSLHALPELYSLRTDLQQSYFSQWLGNAQVPDLEALYCPPGASAPGEAAQAAAPAAGQPSVSPERIGQVVARVDPCHERRNRVLDYLLALYGETFPADSLLRFNRYHTEQPAQWLIECKIALLNQLCQLSMRRGGAANLDQNGISPVQQRLMLVTGCDLDNQTRSLVRHLNQPGQTWVSNQRYLDALPKLDTRTASVLSQAMPAPASGQAALPLPHRMLCDALLQAGCEPTYYRVLAQTGHQGWLCLQVPGHEQPWPLLQLPLADMARVAAQLASQLRELARKAEGMYLVEHILLRVRGSGHKRLQPSAYYSCRASLVLPGFGPRFGDGAFQSWVEELVAQQFPAHIWVELIWLDPIAMTVFETQYHKWHGLLRQFQPDGPEAEPAAQQLDQAAEKLIALLEKHRPGDDGPRWL